MAKQCELCDWLNAQIKTLETSWRSAETGAQEHLEASGRLREEQSRLSDLTALILSASELHNDRYHPDSSPDDIVLPW